METEEPSHRALRRAERFVERFSSRYFSLYRHFAVKASSLRRSRRLSSAECIEHHLKRRVIARFDRRVHGERDIELLPRSDRHGILLAHPDRMHSRRDPGPDDAVVLVRLQVFSLFEPIDVHEREESILFFAIFFRHLADQPKLLEDVFRRYAIPMSEMIVNKMGKADSSVFVVTREIETDTNAARFIVLPVREDPENLFLRHALSLFRSVGHDFGLCRANVRFRV